MKFQDKKIPLLITAGIIILFIAFTPFIKGNTVRDEVTGNQIYTKGLRQISNSYTLESGGRVYNFLNINDKAELTFPEEGLTKNKMELFCDAEGKKINGRLTIYSDATDSKGTIIISSEGKLFSQRGAIKEESGRLYDGLTVYAMDYSTAEKPILLELAFVAEDGTGYTIYGYNLSREQMQGIFEAIRGEKLNLSNYEIYKADFALSSEEFPITLEEAGKLQCFRGVVPHNKKVEALNITKCIHSIQYKNQEIIGETLEITYKGEGSKYLSLSYSTENKGSGNLESTRGFSKEDMIKKGNVFNEDGDTLYSFCLDFHTFTVNVSAVCDEEQLWEFIRVIIFKDCQSAS